MHIFIHNFTTKKTTFNGYLINKLKRKTHTRNSIYIFGQIEIGSSPVN